MPSSMTAALEHLAASLAHCAEFRAMVNADDPEQAARAIHRHAWPCKRCGQTFRQEDWAQALPGAMIWTDVRKGFRRQLTAWGAAGEFLSAGTLWIELMELSAPHHVDDMAALDAHWMPRVGAIVDQLCGLVGQGGMLAFEQIEVARVYYPAQKYFPAHGHVNVAELTIRYDEGAG